MVPSQASSSDKKPSRVRLGFIAAGLFACFLLDIAMPLGVAGGLPYLFVMAAAYFTQSAKVIQAAAVWAIGLILVGIWWSETGIAPTWVAYTNRLYSLLAIIVVTPLLIIAVRSNEQLEYTSRQLVEVINRVSAALVGVDCNGQIRLVNPPAVKLFGYSAEELVGHPIEVLVPKEHQDNHAEHRSGFLKAATSRLMGEGQVLFGLRKDGSEFPVEIGLTQVSNHPDIMVLATILDLSSRLELKAEQRWLAAIIGSSSDAIFSKSLDGVIESWNTSAEKLYGYTAEEMVGKPVSILIPKSEHFQMEDILSKIRDGEKIENLETKRRHKDGWILDVSLSISPIRDAYGRIAGAASIARDITAMKATEATLRMLNQTLARSNEEQERFISIAAHDLKEPLRNMRNLADIIRGDCAGLLPPESDVDLQHIGDQATRMSKLIDDLRHYAKIGGEGHGSVKLDCHEIIEEFSELHAFFLGENNAKVEVRGTLPNVFMVPEHAATIFRNLIANGVKYNDSSEKTVCVGGSARFDMAEFTVSDNGIGIPERSREHVFTMFKRAHVDKKYGGGTGAGLAIVKKIVEQYGGTIDVKSSSQEGTTMRFTLPTRELGT